MKKTYLKSRDGYKPSLTQKIEQFFRCLKDIHIWIIKDVVVDSEIVGELKTCEHCGVTEHYFNT